MRWAHRRHVVPAELAMRCTMGPQLRPQRRRVLLHVAVREASPGNGLGDVRPRIQKCRRCQQKDQDHTHHRQGLTSPPQKSRVPWA